MEEKKIVTISENNIFYKHRREIAEICKNKGVDLGVAAAMLRHEKGWGKETNADKSEFDSWLTYITKESNEQDNKVKRYFEG